MSCQIQDGLIVCCLDFFAFSFYIVCFVCLVWSDMGLSIIGPFHRLKKLDNVISHYNGQEINWWSGWLMIEIIIHQRYFNTATNATWLIIRLSTLSLFKCMRTLINKNIKFDYTIYQLKKIFNLLTRIVAWIARTKARTYTTRSI